MSRARILVVEDEVIVAESVRTKLNSLGYEIPEVAVSGQEAVQMAQEIQPDLVLMDIQLQGSMDGIQAAEQIRALFDVPVVYLTAYADERTLQRAKITEPFGYVLKPFALQELHSTIEMGLYKHQTEQVIRQRTAQLEALRQVSLELTAELDLETLLHSIVSHAIKLLQGHAGGLYLYRPEQNDLEWVVAIGDSVLPVGATIQYGEGLSGKVWQTGEPIIIEDYQHWQGRAATWEGIPICAVIGVPVYWGTANASPRLLGVLNVQAPPGHSFSKDDEQLLSLFATQAAIAIHNARLYQAARQELAERERAEKALRELKEFNEGIVQSINEGIVVEDAEGHLTFVNPSLAALLGYSSTELLGKHWTTIVPLDQRPIVRAANERRSKGKTDRYEIELVDKNGRRIPVLASGSPRFHADHFEGTLSVFTDITERKRAEEAREQLITELQQALAQVKTLSGLLPICANCKKIRDDHGYWHQVEEYVRDHTEADFSHGLCPDCAQKLYPELFDENE
jgi:PAS domain S-box-containing protein